MRILLLSLLLLFTVSIFAQSNIRYDVKLNQVEHHELVITVAIPSVPEGALYIRMPQSSPGRYAEHNFAKNVYAVSATDGRNNPLQVVKITPSEWEITGHDGFVTFQYTLFGNHGDGTYSGMNNRMAHMNMPATFVYAAGYDRRPIEINFDLSGHPDWKVATQLKQLDEDSFYAPNYYYFYDSPTIIGDIDFRSWEVESNEKTYTIEVAMLHEGTDEELNAYVDWVKKVVDTEKEIYGSLPDFDYGKYTFLCSYNPWVYGDGMEHRNSTICTSKSSLAANAKGLIGTVAHEFFHAWNVERIRPKSLEPFNFDQANMSSELWFAEGFTSYYDDLTLARAGILTPSEYAKGLAGTLNYVLNSPGRKYRNPIQMSQHAPFTDAATAIDEDNHSNTFISYYPYGAVIGMALDLRLRAEFEDVNLDDVMRYLWQHVGQPEIPYTIPDLQQAVATVSGDADFATDFFQKHIYDSQLPDMERLLGKMGVVLRLQYPDQPWLKDLRLEYSEKGATIQGNLPETHPLYKAGLNAGDMILEINGQALATAKDFEKLLETVQIGETYSIRYQQNGLEEESTFTVMQHPQLEVLLEDADEKPSDKTLQNRNLWLKK